MNHEQTSICSEIRVALNSLGASPELAPHLRQHVEQCSQCWEHWADRVDANFPIPSVPIAWNRVVSAWSPGPEAAALWKLMCELPPYQQPAGTDNESLVVSGITLQVGSLKLGKKEKRWNAVAIDVTGVDERLRDQWLVGVYPKGAPKQYLAFCAEFTPLKKGGFRATVYLSTQKPDPNSEDAETGTSTAVTSPSARLVLEMPFELKLVELSAPIRRRTDEKTARQS